MIDVTNTSLNSRQRWIQFIGHNSHIFNNTAQSWKNRRNRRDSGSTPEVWWLLKRLSGISSSVHVLQGRIEKRELDTFTLLEGGWNQSFPVVLTDVVIFPHVAEDHVTSQQHSYTADATFLHIDVLVVVSVMAWNRQQDKPQKKTPVLLMMTFLQDSAIQTHEKTRLLFPHLCGWLQWCR